MPVESKKKIWVRPTLQRLDPADPRILVLRRQCDEEGAPIKRAG